MSKGNLIVYEQSLLALEVLEERIQKITSYYIEKGEKIRVFEENSFLFDRF